MKFRALRRRFRTAKNRQFLLKLKQKSVPVQHLEDYMPLRMSHQSAEHFSPAKSASSASFQNVVICYLALLLAITSPVAFYFASRFSNAPGRRLRWHYHYIRTTFIGALLGLILGFSAMIVGANLISSALIPGALLLIATLLWYFLRSSYGMICAVNQRPLHNHKSFLI